MKVDHPKFCSYGLAEARIAVELLRAELQRVSTFLAFCKDG